MHGHMICLCGCPTYCCPGCMIQVSCMDTTKLQAYTVPPPRRTPIHSPAAAGKRALGFAAATSAAGAAPAHLGRAASSTSDQHSCE
jgi:hypothetical protein